MTNKSNDNGRSFEFVCINELKNQISKTRKVSIIKNSSYEAAEEAYKKIPEELQAKHLKSAETAVLTLFELEPLILEDGNDELELLIQPDEKGEEGDVRDVVIIRRNIKWEIGLSLKHNHEAAKHPRLSRKLDFGKSWYQIPCSSEYWDKVTPIFKDLEIKHDNKVLWEQIPNKDDNVYIPLLDAFMNEIKKVYSEDKTLPEKLVSFILGKYDFYKVISIDQKEEVKIIPFNLRGSLNQESQFVPRKKIIEISSLPTEIVLLRYKPNSKTTIEMYMNNGWQFSFRLHNASKTVEPSLKFDVQITGMPSTILTIEKKWNT